MRGFSQGRNDMGARVGGTYSPLLILSTRAQSPLRPPSYYRVWNNLVLHKRSCNERELAFIEHGLRQTLSWH